MIKHAELLKCIVEGTVDPEMIQPNAIDVRLASLETVEDYNHEPFILDNRGTKHRYINLAKEAHLPSFWNGRGFEYDLRALDPVKKYYRLQKGMVYRFLTGLTVHIPEGICGWLIPRSSMIRNGVFVHSGLYDSNYRGLIGAVISNVSGTTYLEENVRIAQFVLADSDCVCLYNGQYQDVHHKST